MSARVEMPTAEILRAIIRYEHDTGLLFWLPRGPELFVEGRWGKQSAADRWNTRWAGKPAFRQVNVNGYLCGEISNRPHRAHRVIWMMVHGVQPEDVDHIDGNRQNNRLQNLRAVTRQENLRNVRRKETNTSGVTGVSWDTARGKWFACLAVDGKTISLGRYGTLEEAKSVRAAANARYGFHQNHGRGQ